jgi:protein transport protein SEC20
MSSRLQALEVRLATLHDTHKSTVQLINRLSNLKFQPGSLPLAEDEGNVRNELTTEIHDNLKKEDDELEILRQEVQESAYTNHSTSSSRDSEREKEQSRLAIQIARLSEDFKM